VKLWPVLLLLFIAGCSVPKGESTMDKMAEVGAKKKDPPPGSMTEEQVGVRFYPDAQVMRTTRSDEGDNHVIEANLSAPSGAGDKVKDFYEKEIGAKSMPMVKPIYSIQSDRNGKHYQVDYGEMGSETTIKITVTTPK
jgi:hypothetical protein